MEKPTRAVVTLKGKARIVDLTHLGLGVLRLEQLTWKGHLQVELTPLRQVDSDPASPVVLPQVEAAASGGSVV